MGRVVRYGEHQLGERLLSPRVGCVNSKSLVA